MADKKYEEAIQLFSKEQQEDINKVKNEDEEGDDEKKVSLHWCLSFFPPSWSCSRISESFSDVSIWTWHQKIDRQWLGKSFPEDDKDHL